MGVRPNTDKYENKVTLVTQINLIICLSLHAHNKLTKNEGPDILKYSFCFTYC